jgi:hypothetical protein
MILASGAGVWAVEGTVKSHPDTASESKTDTCHGTMCARRLDIFGRVFTAESLGL